MSSKKPYPSRRPPSPAELQRLLNEAEDARRDVVLCAKSFVSADTTEARNTAVARLVTAVARLDSICESEGSIAAIAAALYGVADHTDLIRQMGLEAAEMRKRIAKLEAAAVKHDDQTRES